MASLNSPMDLCDRLGLRPTPYQQAILQAFYEDVDPINEENIPAERTCNAAALCALWRLLLIEGSRIIVIAANRELESRFMGFMHDITTSIDPGLTAVCKWSNSKHMTVGDAAGHELRFVSNKPSFLQGIGDEAVTWVILGASSTQLKFGDMMKAVDAYRGREGHRHIVIW